MLGAELRGAYERLSSAYRAGRSTPGGDAEVAAYAVARAPATHAAALAVLAELRRRRPDFAPTSLLDLGAGLGTATWAAVETFPSLEQLTLVERSPAMVEVGRRLATESSSEVLRSASWTIGDARRAEGSATLVVASYLLSELADVESAVPSWWAAAGAHLVVVDTGTPAGFAAVKAARTTLLGAGATISAPCPNDGTCPEDWCHFAVRLARTSEHRRVKSGSLGYEDEKFSYVIGSRGDPAHAAGRIVRHPQIRSGHVRLRVCRDEQLVDVVVSKRHGAGYRWARDAQWGDEVAADQAP